MIKKKPRKTILKKRDKKLDTIGYSKLDIMWFFQWLKLAVDLEGKSVEVGAKKVLVQQTKKRKHLVGGTARGKLHTQKGIGVLGGVLKVQTISGGKWKKQRGTPYKIKVKGWNTINLNELRRLPKIMNMTKNEIFRHFNKWFQKNKHLFGDFSVQLVQDKNNMIDSDDYLTVQIPKSLDRRKIDNQIDTLMKGLKLKTPGGKKRDITFIRGVQQDVMKKQWEVYKWREIDKLSNSYIARNKKSLKYKSGNMLNIRGGKKQTQGVRAVQKSFESAKYLIINVAKGIFPKTTPEED
jgi:hypothetical protein